MPVAQLTLEIRIEHARSLKDRRQVVRSLKDQLRQGFNVSVAEMDEAVVWQSATLGVVAISRSRDYLHGLIEEVERAARRMLNEHGAELADSFWDYIECDDASKQRELSQRQPNTMIRNRIFPLIFSISPQTHSKAEEQAPLNGSAPAHRRPGYCESTAFATFIQSFRAPLLS